MSKRAKIYHIVAHDAERGIGFDNKLPWHIKADLKRFKKLTQTSIVIMGRTTYLSLGSKPLPNRMNVVITSDINTVAPKPGVAVFNNIPEAIAYAKLYAYNHELNYIWIIGGASIYEQTMDMIDGIKLTYILQEVPGADTFYPVIDERFEVVKMKPIVRDLASNLDYSFMTYMRKEQTVQGTLVNLVSPAGLIDSYVPPDKPSEVLRCIIGLVNVTILLEPDKCNLVATASRDNVSESRRLPNKSTVDEIMEGKYDSYITNLVMGVNAKYNKETLSFSSSLFKIEKRKTP